MREGGRKKLDKAPRPSVSNDILILSSRRQCCLEKVENFNVFSARKKFLELGGLTWHESVVSVTFTILVRNMFSDILLSNIF